MQDLPKTSLRVLHLKIFLRSWKSPTPYLCNFDLDELAGYLKLQHWYTLHGNTIIVPQYDMFLCVLATYICSPMSGNKSHTAVVYLKKINDLNHRPSVSWSLTDTGKRLYGLLRNNSSCIT